MHAVLYGALSIEGSHVYNYIFEVLQNLIY
jgi:hypothetical protein